MTEQEKEKDYRRLNIDIEELMLNYKESSLTPGEFSHRIVQVLASLCMQAGCCLHSTTMLLQDAVSTGICAGLELVHPGCSENPCHGCDDD